MVATHIKKIKHSLLFCDFCALKQNDLHEFCKFALEFESSERLLFLFSLSGSLRTATLTTIDYFNFLIVYGVWPWCSKDELFSFDYIQLNKVRPETAYQ